MSYIDDAFEYAKCEIETKNNRIAIETENGGIRVNAWSTDGKALYSRLFKKPAYKVIDSAKRIYQSGISNLVDAIDLARKEARDFAISMIKSKNKEVAYVEESSGAYVTYRNILCSRECVEYKAIEE